MSTRADKRRWALAVLLVPAATLLVFLVLVGLSARSLSLGGAVGGSIRLDDVELQHVDAQLYLDATAAISLPDSIRAGLDSGVPLEFVLRVVLLQPRPYWFDKSLVQFIHRFRLTYYELTRHYRVQSLDTDVSRNYRSLSAALEGLGDFEQLALAMGETVPLLQAAYEADTGSADSIKASLEFQLDSKSLPLPLQPLVGSSWRLASEEYQWSVN